MAVKYRCTACGSADPCSCQVRRSDKPELRSMTLWCAVKGVVIEVPIDKIEHYHEKGCPSCDHGSHTVVSFECPACRGQWHRAVL